MRHSAIWRGIWIAIIAGILSACNGGGSQAGPAPAAGATAAPTAAAAPQPTQAPTVLPTTPGSGAIPEGTTAEGYHVLGDPNAKVTLVMYSDFL